MLRIIPLVPYFNSSSDSPDFLMNALLFLSGTSFQIPSFSKWLFSDQIFCQVRLLFPGDKQLCTYFRDSLKWHSGKWNPRGAVKNRMAKYDRLWDFLWIKMSQMLPFPQNRGLGSSSHYIWILHYSGIPRTFWKTF